MDNLCFTLGGNLKFLEVHSKQQNTKGEKGMKRTVFSALAVCLVLLASSASFSDIIISEIADPDDVYQARFVEIYNTGLTNVDLSTGWALLRYANGGVTPATHTLTSTINSCSALTIAFNATDFQNNYGFAPDESNGAVITGNGDDVYAIWDGTQIVDIYGVIGVDGTGEVWEYEDGQAIRRISTLPRRCLMKTSGRFSVMPPAVKLKTRPI